MIKIVKNSWVMLVFCSIFTQTSFASGFALIEQSASGMGNAFSGGAASAEDASTIFFNPPGMSKLNREFLGAGHLIMPSSEFSNKGSTASPLLGGAPLSGGNGDDGGVAKFVPNVYGVIPLSKTTRFGLGIYAPFGLATHYDDTWVGRYHGVESDLKITSINPSISYQAEGEKISLGFGLNFEMVDIALSNAVDLGAVCFALFDPATVCTPQGVTPQASDGFVKFTGNHDRLGIGFNFGMLYEPKDGTRYGFSYRSKVEHEVRGDADFTVPGNASFLTSSGAFTKSGIKSEVTLPETASFSTYQKVGEKLAWMADITWTNWRRFDELRILYDNPVQPPSVTREFWHSSKRFALGVNYKMSPSWTMRTGLAYDETPIPNKLWRTPRVPGNDRTWISFGSSFALGKSVVIDAGYSHLFVSTTPIQNEFESGIPTLAATLKGDYAASVDIFSAQLRWIF